MAYKFQLGSARLSGSTTFEQPLVAESTFSATSLSASAGLQVGGTVELDGVLDVVAAPASDSFYILDATDGLMKKESMSAYATTIAGDGLAAASGVLKVDVSDFAGAGLEDDGSENLRIAAAAAGAGLGGGAGSALSVNVDDSSIEIDSDTLRVKDNGVTLAKMAGIARGSIISGDASGDPQALAVGSAHQFLQSDGTDLAYVSMSGDATLAAGVLSIGATKVTDAMMNDDVAAGLAGVGLSAAGGSMALDLNELSAGAIDVSADSFALIDADDSNGSKKESIADFMTAIAGTGLKAEAGVLEVRVSGSVVRSNDKIGITGSFAGNGLTYEGGVNSISSIAVNVNSTSFAISSDEVQLASGVAGDGLALGSHALSVNVDDSTIETDSDALRIKDNGVTLAKMADLARGKFIVGDSSGNPSALALGSAHQFLQSDGTDLAYVSMSGDATLAAGVLSIGATKVTDAMMNDDVAAGLAGDGLGASSGVMAVQVTGAVRITSDKVGISGSFAGNGLTYEGGVNSISKIDLNANSTSFAIGSDELQLASGVAGDGLALGSHALSVNVDDSTIETDSDALRLKDNGVTLAKMAGLARGKFIIGDSNGDPSALALGSAAQFLVSDGDDLLYRSLSGDATINAAGVLTIGAGAVEGSMLNDNAISGQTDIGGPIAEADELLISDNGSLRRTDVSRLRAMTVAARANGDTLATGVNYFADLTSDAGVTLPASPQPGDKVIVKAKGLTSAVITISRAGSHTIDGETAVVIESPFGAVTCVYVAVNDWRIV